MLIRREVPADVPVIHAVTASAFAKPDVSVSVEAALVDQLRAGDSWLPELSFVAIGDREQVVGHVVCTRGHVDDVPVLALGPLSVHPDHQRRGVGLALVHSVLGAGDAAGEPLVCLLGSPDYYGRFGFQASREFGIVPPDLSWDTYFQVRPLTAYDPAVRGAFAYAEPFNHI